jgi:hypothetical protein
MITLQGSPEPLEESPHVRSRWARTEYLREHPYALWDFIDHTELPLTR